MIDEKRSRKYCKEDISKIANYDLAISDKTQTWHCHHILGEILSREQLLDHDFYYDVPPCMLKFVTKAEHKSLHGKNMSNEARRKISEANKGKNLSDETRRKMSEAKKNMSNETRRKMSEAKKNMSNETRRKMSEAAKRRWAVKAR